MNSTIITSCPNRQVYPRYYRVTLYTIICIIIITNSCSVIDGAGSDCYVSTFNATYTTCICSIYNKNSSSSSSSSSRRLLSNVMTLQVASSRVQVYDTTSSYLQAVPVIIATTDQPIVILLSFMLVWAIIIIIMTLKNYCYVRIPKVLNFKVLLLNVTITYQYSYYYYLQRSTLIVIVLWRVIRSGKCLTTTSTLFYPSFTMKL